MVTDQAQCVVSYMRTELERQDLQVLREFQKSAQAQICSMDRVVGGLLLVETDRLPLGRVPHWFFKGATHTRQLVELFRGEERENGQLEVEIQLLEVDGIAFMAVYEPIIRD